MKHLKLRDKFDLRICEDKNEKRDYISTLVKLKIKGFKENEKIGENRVNGTGWNLR